MIKNNNFITVLIGHKDKIDFDALSDYGTVKEVTLDELFGYESTEKVVIQ